MLQVFSIYFYALFDYGATLSFLTPLVAKKFNVLLDVLMEPFPVITPVGDFVVAIRDFRCCTIYSPN